MTETATSRPTDVLRAQIEERRSIDVRLPQGGRLYVDRPLPFVCLHRSASDEESLTHRLVTAHAAYLVASDEPEHHDELTDLLATLSELMIDRFGRFLVLEIWEEVKGGEADRNEPLSLQPEFRISAPDHEDLRATVTELAVSLKRVVIHDLIAAVHVACRDDPGPLDRAPVEPVPDAGRFHVGLEVAPIYRDAARGTTYPFLFEDLRRQVAEAVKKALFRFGSDLPSFEAPSHLGLGRRALEQAVSKVDEGLARIDESFEFLLQTTPVNADEAWTAFEESGFRKAPVLRYRPLPVDPELLKRRLFALPIEEVEDPMLSWLFREKQEELDRKVTMLRDRNTRQFYYGSLQVYGEVGHGLLELAKNVLDRLPHRDYDLGSTENLDAEAFAEVAAVEFNHYRKACADFPETVQIRRDMPAGLMVSGGRLLIGHRTRVPAPRIEALLHHEVGTHMLTYFNGRAQPLRLLYNGLAGYETLQEGIAVLAEFLCGGLSVPRLRVLAARVLAVHGIIEGCSFPELYAMLQSDYDFGEHEAYSITLRTFRGGGLIKDVIYLRGFHELTSYLRDGGDLEALLVGKIALHHLPLIAELRDRGVLRDAPLEPRYLRDELAQERLFHLREARSIIDLIESQFI